MSDKINVEAILRKHDTAFYLNPEQTEYMVTNTKREAMKAIKEIVTEVLKLATNEVKATGITVPNCDDHTPYYGKCISCGRMDNPDIIVGVEVDKQSILNVAKLVEYE